MQPFWALFTQIWGKKDFPGKRVLSGFKYSNYLPLCQKLEKANEFIPEKIAKLLDGQTDNSDFIGPSVGLGPIIKTTLRFPEFTSTHQKSHYSINFFVRHNQF